MCQLSLFILYKVISVVVTKMFCKVTGYLWGTNFMLLQQVIILHLGIGSHPFQIFPASQCLRCPSRGTPAEHSGKGVEGWWAVLGGLTGRSGSSTVDRHHWRLARLLSKPEQGNCRRHNPEKRRLDRNNCFQSANQTYYVQQKLHGHAVIIWVETT